MCSTASVSQVLYPEARHQGDRNLRTGGINDRHFEAWLAGVRWGLLSKCMAISNSNVVIRLSGGLFISNVDEEIENDVRSEIGEKLKFQAS